MRLQRYLCKLLLLDQLVFFLPTFYSKLLCGCFIVLNSNLLTALGFRITLKEAIPLPRCRFKTERRGGALVYGHEVCGLNTVHVLQ